MESLRRNFFNGVQEGDRKIAWVKWSKVLASKKFGGLGASSFFALNRALLFKWVWRYLSRDNSLWYRVIFAIHGLNGKSLSAAFNSSWSSIIKEVKSLKAKGVDLISHCKIRVGKGTSTSFWNDLWIGDSQLKVFFPRLFALEENKDILIADKLNSSLSSSFRRPVRGGEETQQFDELSGILASFSLSSLDDRWFWDLSGDGTFQVKGIRSLLDETFLPKMDTPTRWIKSIPIKVNVFVWKLSLGRLPTRSNLIRRNILVSDVVCPLCDLEIEDSSHLFFGCSLAKDIQKLICRWWNLEVHPYESYNGWLSWFKSIRLGTKLKDILEGVFYVFWWSIWYFRNHLLFTDLPPRKDAIFDNIILRSFNCSFTNTINPSYGFIHQTLHPKNEEYDIWAMKMEHYLGHIDYLIWQVIHNGNGHVSVITYTNGIIKVLPSKTAKEVVARERERKAMTTLLMALSEDHLAKFHKIADAKKMWKAIKSRFGGNDESKKMQKYLLKQQFEGFFVSTSEGLHKGYDRFQTLLGQLEIHGAGVSHEDANQKFLRFLPFFLSQVALIMRTKPRLDTFSFDDLYNNLRVFECDVKGTTASSSNTQNVAFVSAENTSSTNDVSTPYSVSSPSILKSQKEGSSSYTDEVIYSFANQSSAPQLEYDDLEQINDDDMEEMDLKWQSVFMNKANDLEDTPVNDRFAYGTHAVPPPMTGNYMPSGLDVEIDYSKFTYGPKQTSADESDSKPNSNNDSVSNVQEDKEKPSFAFTDSVKHVKTSRKNIKETGTTNHSPKIEKHDRNGHTRKGLGYAFTRKTCFVCGSFSHLIRDFNPVRNKSLSVVGGNGDTAVKVSVGCNWRYKRISWNKVSNYNSGSKFRKSVKDPLGRLKSEMAWVPKRNYFLLFQVQDDPHKALKDKRIVDSRCSRYMTGNKAHLTDYKEFKGGSVAFGGRNGRIMIRSFATKELTSPKQMALCNDISNPLMAGRLPKTTLPTRHGLYKDVDPHEFTHTTAKVKTINNEDRIQAIIDEKRVNIKEYSIRRTLKLDDAEGTSCLANAEIFDGLAKMGYGKLSEKLTFYKAFFSPQWNLVKNIEAGVPFFMFPRFVQLLIDHQLGDMSHHKDIYDNPSLTKKVFANMKRVGTGFSMVVTPLFDNMLVPTAKEVGLIQDDVQLPSPSNYPLPSGKDSLKLKELMNLCTYLSNKLLELESKVIDIKSTYKERIEKREGGVDRLEENRVLKELHSVHSKVDIVALVVEKEKSFKHERIIADIDEDVEINLEEAQAKPYRMDLEHPEKVLSMQDVDDEEPAEVEEVLKVVTAAKLITKVVTTAGVTTITEATKVSVSRKRRGVVIQDPEETTSTVVMHSKIEKDEAFARQLEAELNAYINWNAVIKQVKRSERLNDAVMKYQALKRKPLTEAQARKNMIIYLKNMIGYKMNYFKGMTYIPEKEVEVKSHKREDESLEKEITKKQKMDEEEEELKSHLQIVSNDDDDVYTEATPLASKILIVDYKIHLERNKPYFKIVRADAIDQKGWYGLAKVKRWKQFESCGVHCITFSTTQMFLLVEKRYPLTHFTLGQMLNNVRLEVEEESEMSLELLRLVRRQLNEGYVPE
nr:hypothetical protein [Tanacetum cinerariifolium]